MSQQARQEVIEIDGISVTVTSKDGNDYISLNDLAVKKTDRPAIAIGNWMRNRNTVELLGIWEISNNPDFRKNAGLNSFTLPPSKWIEQPEL